MTEHLMGTRGHSGHITCLIDSLQYSAQAVIIFPVVQIWDWGQRRWKARIYPNLHANPGLLMLVCSLWLYRITYCVIVWTVLWLCHIMYEVIVWTILWPCHIMYCAIVSAMQSGACPVGILGECTLGAIVRGCQSCSKTLGAGFRGASGSLLIQD